MTKDGTRATASGARVPKQERSRKTQEHVVTAALGAFAERRYEGTSVSLIAERAGVGQPLVVYHFPTKEDLWVATVETALGRFLERAGPMLEALQRLRPAIQLSLVFRQFVEFCAGTPELLQLLMDASQRGGPGLTRVIEGQLRPTYELFRELIESAQPSGDLLPGDPGLIYYAMIAVSSTVFSLNREFELMTGRDPFEPDMVEAQASLLVRLFFPGLSDAGGAGPWDESATPPKSGRRRG